MARCERENLARPKSKQSSNSIGRHSPMEHGADRPRSPLNGELVLLLFIIFCDGTERLRGRLKKPIEMANERSPLRICRLAVRPCASVDAGTRRRGTVARIAGMST